MIYEGNSIIEMFKNEFSKLVITDFLVETYNKIYNQLSVINQGIFDSNYTLEEDYYILNDLVTDENKTIIINEVMVIRYNNWFFGFPDTTGDILFSMYNKTYEDNNENEYKRVSKVIHIFADKQSYNELEIISQKLKSITIYDNIDISERTYNNIVFKEVESVGMATKLEGSYQIEIFDNLYYPIEIIFNLVYYK